jgi:CheY-like chemotaxis protein
VNDKSTILIVDDDESNLLLMEYLLGKEKYHTVSATNAERALKIISENQIDIILSDVMMPGMDGFELTKEIRKNPKTRLIPIVLLTGLEEVQFRIQGIEAGCDDFITKPSIDYLNKPYYKEEVLSRIKMLLQMNFYRLQINEKEKFELLLNGIGDGYILLDKEGNIEKSNIKAREWLLLLTDNVEKTSFKEQIKRYFNLDDEENVYETMPFYNLSFEMERQKSSQYSHLILECRSFPFRENYELENLLILIHDITDQKRESRLKKDFLNSITQIITSQLSGLQKLTEKSKGQSKEEIDNIVVEMNLRIQQLLNYSCNIDDTSSLFPVTINFQEFIDEIKSDFQSILQTQKIKLTIHNNQHIDSIKIRRDLVKIIFVELLFMSINHTTKNEQEINLTLTQKNDWLKLTFENDDFNTIESINNNSVVIIKHIASLLKGKIEMDIQEDTGSMFILQIPSLSQKN